MTLNPKFTITTRINKALVEIERVRGFLDVVKLKDKTLHFTVTYCDTVL